MTPEMQFWQWFFQNFGWPGLMFVAIVLLVRWYIMTKYPQDREDRLAAMLADQKSKTEWYAIMRDLVVEVRALSLMFHLEFPHHRRTLEAQGIVPPKNQP